MATLSAIQRGSKTLSGGTASMTIVRGTDAGFNTTVTAASTILIVTYRATSGVGLINWELTDGDTITVARTDTTGDVVVFWTLLSFTSGVVVQHKSVSLSTVQTTNTAAINATSIGGGRWIIAGGVNNSGSNGPHRAWGRWKIDSSTQISVTRTTADGSDSIVCKCQVVEYDSATVQVVEKTLTTTTSTTDDTTITGVDTAKTAIWGTMQAGGAGTMTDQFWDGFLTSTTNFRIERNGTTSSTLTLTAYVVEFTDSASVQAVAVTHSDGVGTVNTTITAIDTSKACPLTSGISPGGMSAGRTATSTANYERQYVSSELTTTTNVQTVRGSTSGAQAYHSQVVQFATASTSAVGALAGQGGGLAGMGSGLAGPGGLAGRYLNRSMTKINGLWQHTKQLIRPRLDLQGA